MVWPVAIPITVSTPAQTASAAAIRFDRLVGRSLPLDQIDAALVEGAIARAALLKSMKALRQVRMDAKAEQKAAAKAAERYAREEARIIAARDAAITGERMATAMKLEGPALARVFA